MISKNIVKQEMKPLSELLWDTFYNSKDMFLKSKL